MGTLFTQRSVRVTALVCLLVGMVWLVLARAGTVQAAGVVSDCTQQGLADAMVSSGLITFGCGPATIVLTQSGGLNVDSGYFFTIDGGNLITLNGGDTNRLFNVKPGGR
jgi:hypothetical protein